MRLAPRPPYPDVHLHDGVQSRVFGAAVDRVNRSTLAQFERMALDEALDAMWPANDGWHLLGRVARAVGSADGWLYTHPDGTYVIFGPDMETVVDTIGGLTWGQETIEEVWAMGSLGARHDALTGTLAYDEAFVAPDLPALVITIYRHSLDADGHLRNLYAGTYALAAHAYRSASEAEQRTTDFLLQLGAHEQGWVTTGFEAFINQVDGHPVLLGVQDLARLDG